MVTLRFVARSHPGLVRDHNEDAFTASERMLLVADGVGGEAAGEIASALAVEAFTKIAADGAGDEPEPGLRAAVERANEAIEASVEESPERSGMATTLTGLLFGPDRLDVVHVGDSRAYLWRDGELTRITRDDSYVQDLVDEGALNAEDIPLHPYRSVVTKVLQGYPVEPTVTPRHVEVGDGYLVCSDGLTDYVAEDIVAEVLRRAPDERHAVDGLIAATLAAGAGDNVTVLFGVVVDDPEQAGDVGGAAESGPGDEAGAEAASGADGGGSA